MVRSLNRIQLIGNLTRDPELRYTPQGTAVCTFSVATNRQWKTEGGDTRDEAEFHRIVAWDKLAEICSQMLTKGKRVFVEGRIQTRKWTGQDGQARTTVEVVISDMIVLDRLGREGESVIPEDLTVADDVNVDTFDAPEPKKPTKAIKKPSEEVTEAPTEVPEETQVSSEPVDDDIPF
jgi:single-strand DNA-binding protein